jgi:hypothetical protein
MTSDRPRADLGGFELLGLGIFNSLCLAAGLGLGWFAGLGAGVVGTWVQLKKYVNIDRST